MTEKQEKNTATFGEIAEQLRLDPEPWATHILGEEPASRSRGQVRYFSNNSLVVFTSGRSQGRFKWFCDDSSRSKGDMIDLYRFHRGGSSHDAIEYAKTFLGIADGKIDLSKMKKGPTEEEKKAEQEKEDRERVRKANWLWQKGSQKDGRDAGLAYLRGRAITVAVDSNTLRFRSLSPKDLEKMGVSKAEMPKTPVTALIFAARNGRGEVTAVQQIFTTQGRKAPFENNKRTNGLMQGAAVWLGDPSSSDKAAMAEGPETGLSIHQATGLPTCIALGTSNFMRIELPSNIKDLVIAADMEKTGVGLGFALRAAQFWKHQGLPRVGIALPPRLNDGDFNDVHQAQGEDAVRHAIENAHYGPDRARDGTVLATADSRAAFYAWVKTGIEVMPRVPARNRETGKFMPLALDGLVEPEHNRVLLVQTPSITIEDEFLRKARPELEIIELHNDSRAFRELARTPGAMEQLINSVDIYQPDGLGDVEPVFVSLRRADADALKLPGHVSVAVRATAVDRIDFGFLKDREVIIAPIGNGTDADRRLGDRITQAGGDTTRITWQLFRADQDAPALIRRSIPEGYGASDAAKEGWTGPALADLVEISRANQRQLVSQTARSEESLAAPTGRVRAHGGDVR